MIWAELPRQIIMCTKDPTGMPRRSEKKKCNWNTFEDGPHRNPGGDATLDYCEFRRPSEDCGHEVILHASMDHTMIRAKLPRQILVCTNDQSGYHDGPRRKNASGILSRMDHTKIRAVMPRQAIEWYTVGTQQTNISINLPKHTF